MWWLILVVAYLPPMFGVYYLAERSGRDATGWTIGSLFLSPFVCIVILWCLGETPDKWKERITNEELLRKRIRESIACPNCQNPNDRKTQFCTYCGTELEKNDNQ